MIKNLDYRRVLERVTEKDLMPSYEELYSKLSRYEDTGLTPEQIEDMAKRIKDTKEFIASIPASKDEGYNAKILKIMGTLRYGARHKTACTAMLTKKTKRIPSLWAPEDRVIIVNKVAKVGDEMLYLAYNADTCNYGLVSEENFYADKPEGLEKMPLYCDREDIVSVEFIESGESSVTLLIE